MMKKNLKLGLISGFVSFLILLLTLGSYSFYYSHNVMLYQIGSSDFYAEFLTVFPLYFIFTLPLWVVVNGVVTIFVIVKNGYDTKQWVLFLKLFVISSFVFIALIALFLLFVILI